jgi:ubiquitin-protein ligase
MNDMIKPLKLLKFGNMFRQTYRPIHHFLIVLISLMFWLLPQSHAEPIDTQSIELQLNLNAAKISLNEPVLIDVQFKNLSNTPINMELGSNSITAFELSIKGPNETSFQRYTFVPHWGLQGLDVLY